ncbi:palmdelphin isoform 2-T2 [Anomaloglossus baeobatrachus]|uniref:palmdelphin isoform X2 n=1 Tax=Anomaloglossus baeobatrachus TaxID=238106 RepID=UPI003F5032E9
MEEAELLKERLLAITDKRKLQEEIAQRRLKIEEEKLKLHHLQKKALREKWLLDGLNTMTPMEQEEMIKQNQEDQKSVKFLEHNIGRLEQEIEDLEKQETQLSAKEVRVLQKLKSVERTTEDIIKAVKAEAREEPEPIKDIYAGIPDLPPSYKPSFIRRMESAQFENGEEARKALFAMEIKVEKDMKTGKNKVISSIPVPSDEIKDAGVKVYDDGRKSVYAVSSGGKMVKNGIDSLAPIEVEDLLRKATERSTQSPTEYHEPVFSNAFHSSATHKGQVSPSSNGHRSPVTMEHQNGHSSTFTEEIPIVNPSVPENLVSHQPRVMTQNGQANNVEFQVKETRHEASFRNSPDDLTTYYPAELEDNVHYNIVHATPCYVDDNEPVTMIFMGYKQADENDSRPLTDYEGVIRAELVVIDDDEENNKEEKRSNDSELINVPETQPLHISNPSIPTVQKVPTHNIALHSPQPYKNSISLREQDATLGPDNYLPVAKQDIDDGTEDPSLTALRIRMAKLGKKVI